MQIAEAKKTSELPREKVSRHVECHMHSTMAAKTPKDTLFHGFLPLTHGRVVLCPPLTS